MISRSETEKIAALARLEFSDEGYEKITVELNSIIGYIDQLKEVDVNGVEPLENINEAVEKNTLRDDISMPSLTTEEALSNAPKKGDGYFLVPKVIEQQQKLTVISEDDSDEFE